MAHVDTSSFALEANLATLKTVLDKLHIYKLVPVLTDLSKLSNVVKNDVVKKDVYDKLVTKKSNIDTSEFALKSKYKTDKTVLENKTPNVTDFVKKVKLTELENKIPDISNLVTKSVLTIVENKIPSNKSKHLLVENKLKNVKNLDSSYFLGKYHFDGGGVQSYFVFQSITR